MRHSMIWRQQLLLWLLHARLTNLCDGLAGVRGWTSFSLYVISICLWLCKRIFVKRFDIFNGFCGFIDDNYLFLWLFCSVYVFAFKVYFVFKRIKWMAVKVIRKQKFVWWIYRKFNFHTFCLSFRLNIFFFYRNSH